MGVEEGQNTPSEEVRRLKDHGRLLEEMLEDLRYVRRRTEKLCWKVSMGFAELGSALGMTYEMHANACIQVLLEKLYHDSKVGRGYVLKNGDVLEINMFCEEPLVVGEVTTKLEDEEKADREIVRLLERVEAVSTKYRKKPFMVVVWVGVAPENIVKKLRTEIERHGIKLILRREVEEA